MPIPSLPPRACGDLETAPLLIDAGADLRTQDTR